MRNFVVFIFAVVAGTSGRGRRENTRTAAAAMQRGARAHDFVIVLIVSATCFIGQLTHGFHISKLYYNTYYIGIYI